MKIRLPVALGNWCAVVQARAGPGEAAIVARELWWCHLLGHVYSRGRAACFQHQQCPAEVALRLADQFLAKTLREGEVFFLGHVLKNVDHLTNSKGWHVSCLVASFLSGPVSPLARPRALASIGSGWVPTPVENGLLALSWPHLHAPYLAAAVANQDVTAVADILFHQPSERLL